MVPNKLASNPLNQQHFKLSTHMLTILFWFLKHIYENHLDMLHEQLRREPYPAPKLILSNRIPDYAVTGKYEPEWLEKVEPGDFQLDGYKHHAPLTAPMAV